MWTTDNDISAAQVIEWAQCKFTNNYGDRTYALLNRGTLPAGFCDRELVVTCSDFLCADEVRSTVNLVDQNLQTGDIAMPWTMGDNEKLWLLAVLREAQEYLRGPSRKGQG